MRIATISLMLVTSLVSVNFCIASKPEQEVAPKAVAPVAFESGLFRTANGAIVQNIPAGDVAGLDHPICADVPKALYRSMDAYLMLYFQGSISGFGSGGMQALYDSANARFLEQLLKLPALALPEGLDKGSRFFHNEKLVLKAEPLAIGMTLTETRGTIRIESSDINLNGLFQPLSRLVIISTCPKSPIQKMIFYLANNQKPMRICGTVKFSAQPEIHLETINVSTIKVCHTYKDYKKPEDIK